MIDINKCIRVCKAFKKSIATDGMILPISKDCEELVNTLEDTVEVLERQLNNGWISVSKRLPKEPDSRGIWVLTCATSGLVETNHFCNGQFYDAEKRGYEIIAWQLKPEKYVIK